MCFQFRNVDNNKICKHCSIKEARKVASKIKLVLYKSTLRPEIVSTDKVMRKEDWFYIRRLIDNFYASVTYEDIDWMNKEKDLNRTDTGKRIVSGFVYLMQADNGYYKIGRSIDVDFRNKQHMRDYPLVITVLHSFFCKDYVKAETHLLRMFSDKKLQGEWFALEKADVDFIMNITDEIALRLF